MVALTSVVGAALGLFVAMLWTDTGVFGGEARMSIQSTDAVWLLRDGARVQLDAGVGVAANQSVEFDGPARFEYSDSDVGGPNPVAEIDVAGGAVVGVLPESLLLYRGTLQLNTRRNMVVRLPDGTRIELGAGRYLVDVLEQRPLDFVMRRAENELAVWVENLSGAPANVVRPADQGAETVVAGWVGQYRSGEGGILVGEAPGPIAGGDPRALPGRPPEAPPELVGYVFQADVATTPVADSGVRLWFRSGSDWIQRQLTSGADGRFELAQGSGLKSGFVVVAAVPSWRHGYLGITAPDVYRLEQTAAGYQLQRRVMTHRAPIYRGVVLDDVGAALPGALLVPCLRDDVLGLCWPWFDLAQQSAALGSFDLAQLPGDLPPQLSLGLIAWHADFEPGYVPLPRPREGGVIPTALQLKVRLRRPRPVTLRNLPANATGWLYEQVLPELPGAGARRHRLEPAGGVAALTVGRGRLWLEVASASGEALVELVPGPDPETFKPASGAPLAWSEVFRTQLEVPGAADLRLARDFRYADYRPSSGPGKLHLFGAGGVAVGAQAFALEPLASGGYRPRFVGLQLGSRAPIDVDFDPSETVVLGISGDDGSVAFHDPGQSSAVELLPVGSVRLGPAARPVQSEFTLLEFRPQMTGIQAGRPPIYRYAAQVGDWVVEDLPAGSYEVLDPRGGRWQVQVEPGQQHTIP